MGKSPGYGSPARALAFAGVLAVGLSAGCGAKTTDLAAGGFAAGDGDKLSLVVAQARAQFPDLSAKGLAYAVHDGKLPAPTPELALQGEGSGFSRGLQLTERGKGSLKLFLDKSTYARGHAVVKVDGEKEQTWPIVAYELRGRADRAFEFSYLLALPDGGVRYLVLLGGSYADGDADVVAYEGILFVPAPGKPLDDWKRAFKFDFGFKHPARPAYQAKVEEADTLFKELQRDASALESLTQRLEQAQADAASARQAGEGAPRRGPDAATLEARAGELKAQRDQRAADAEARVLRYYEARRAADDGYAAFVNSSPYTWRDAAGQTEFYKRWQVVEFHHPRIDELVSQLARFVPDGKKVETVRTEAMAVFAKNNNWDKDPARKAATPEKAQ